jgi:UDP-3-O-[3-hydroxymyristoyl] N-acetylglucosamine deacetylase
MHATVIKTCGWAVSSVEHLMAAVWVAGLTNLEIVVSGAEIPILDGSALLFWQAIKNAGIVDQDKEAVSIEPRRELVLADAKGRRLVVQPRANPGGHLSLEYTADFKHLLVGGGSFKADLTGTLFGDEIAPARTFGFLEQLPLLRFHQLARGTSLGNSVVIGDDVMNEMRFVDECVRHKVLDLVGDMALLGVCLQADVVAHKTSHDFNRLLVQHYLLHPDEWRRV